MAFRVGGKQLIHIGRMFRKSSGDTRALEEALMFDISYFHSGHCLLCRGLIMQILFGSHYSLVPICHTYRGYCRVV